MTEPVLIRVWDNERKPLGHCVRPFLGGYFTIPEGDPLARAIVDASEAGDITVTVFTQHEFEWHVTDYRLGDTAILLFQSRGSGNCLSLAAEEYRSDILRIVREQIS